MHTPHSLPATGIPLDRQDSEKRSACQRCGIEVDASCLEWLDHLGLLCAYCILEEDACSCADVEDE